MKKVIRTHRVFVESFVIEICEDREIVVSFDSDVASIQENLRTWTPAEIEEQIRAESLEIGRALFEGLPVTYVAIDDGRAFYRVDAGLELSRKLIRTVFDRAVAPARPRG